MQNDEELSADKIFAPPSGDMSAPEFRRAGYEMIDWIAAYFERLEDLPVLSQNQPNDLKNALPKSAPETGEDFSTIFGDVEKLILPAVTNWNHPNFHGLFSTSTSAAGIFGEMLAATFDMKAMLWRTAPASTELEEVVLDWLRKMMNLDAGFKGIIYDTASVSTLHAIAAAREGLDLKIRENGMSGRADLPLLRVYTSEQSHSSVEKAVILLGLGQKGLRKIPTNERFEMDAQKLREAIEEDKRNGFLPFCVVATVGTTSTTSIDPIEEIVPVCEENAMWLHVDAAYAGSAAIVSELQSCLKGCERADSVVTNPHKWLFTPFDLSVLYCRHLDLLKRAFSLVPEYLKTDEAVTNQMDYGIQLGRRFRALKLWFVLRYFGQSGLIERIREHCRLAKLLASWIEADENWELLAPVPFALVCFRACPKNVEKLNELNEKIMNETNATGKAYISHTKLNDKFTLRVSIGSLRVEERHVEKLWTLLNEKLAEIK
ncbi:MAG: aminotransferase class I/II-fold pyridoxal phosphate-dependent enzyme [Acidobacteria bacterium]|jgi:aromatic-L-amino-acid decarboxylase|nr:aminotransferase class I/II-fold pyridoxal phosphate-dependent enzyme [Acidobacteriota bacterium]